MTIILASNNKHKVEEIQAILAETDIEIKTLADINFHEDIIEDGDTLEDNAWIKADTIHELTGLNVMADDTGLEVDALDGRPGVHSARYAGPQRDSEDNMNLLIQELSEASSRNAQFRTVIALWLDGRKHQFEGVIRGTIGSQRQGVGGFGYDPIFTPKGFEDSFGVLSSDIKNEISHRGRAVKKVADFLKGL